MSSAPPTEDATSTRPDDQPGVSPVDVRSELPVITVTVTVDLIHEAARKARKYDADAPVSDRSCDELMLDGILLEEALCRAFDVERDREIYAEGEGDDGHDVELGGWQVDGKARRYSPPYLLIPASEDITAEAYAIGALTNVYKHDRIRDVLGRDVEVELWGFAVADLVREKRIDTRGPRPDVLDRTVYPEEFSTALKSRE